MRAIMKPSIPSVPWQGTSAVKFPLGRMLVEHINGHYPTVRGAILEFTQNGIDANATHIDILVDRKRRVIKIADNGDGVSKEMFDKALSQVTVTMKDSTKFGQFGLGTWGAVKKCARHVVISCPKGGRVYHEWTFVTEDIVRMVDTVSVPFRIREDLRHVSDSRPADRFSTRVPWQTLVEIHDYSSDRLIGHIPEAQELFDEIVANFRTKMLERDIKISITISRGGGGVDHKEGYASPYNGTPLPEIVLGDDQTGRTHLRLFLARKNKKGAYIGQGVSIGEANNPFRFPFKIFAKSDTCVVGKEVIEALSSGVFEGDIITDGPQLHPNRKSFVAGDALLAFCEAVEGWYVQVGKSYFDAAIDSQTAENYRELGENLKSTLEGLLKDDKFKDLLKSMQGGIRLQRKQPSKNGSGESNDNASRNTTSRGAGDEGGGGSDTTSTDQSARQKPPRSRSETKSETLGLDICYGEIHEPKLWKYEPGVLTFNILHSLWRECEKSKRRLKQLQELIAVKVLVLMTLPEEWQAHAGTYLEELVDPMVFLLTQSPNFQHVSRSKDGKEKSKK